MGNIEAETGAVDGLHLVEDMGRGAGAEPRR